MVLVAHVFNALPIQNHDQPLESSDYFLVLRYLDSAPVVQEFPSPRFFAGRGAVRCFRCDGLYLWDDLEHSLVQSAQVTFRPSLVERAKHHSGVVSPLSEELLTAVRSAIADEATYQ